MTIKNVMCPHCGNVTNVIGDDIVDEELYDTGDIVQTHVGTCSCCHKDVMWTESYIFHSRSDLKII